MFHGIHLCRKFSLCEILRIQRSFILVSPLSRQPVSTSWMTTGMIFGSEFIVGQVDRLYAHRWTVLVYLGECLVLSWEIMSTLSYLSDLMLMFYISARISLGASTTITSSIVRSNYGVTMHSRRCLLYWIPLICYAVEKTLGWFQLVCNQWVPGQPWLGVRACFRI